MKRNGFMEFLNEKGQLAAIFAFIAVAGICAGATALNRGTNESEPTKNEQLEEPVITNKNAKPETGETVKTPQISTNETAQPQEKTEEKTEEKAEDMASFDDEDTDDLEIALSWPVNGNILMGYSPSKLVYDATLDQYRTTDSVCIEAKEGDKVKSAADGRIAKVVEDETLGNYVVVEHENGWTTTYSQLADIQVAAGETVSKGEILGFVAQPSIYSSAIGSHVEFKVMLDDMTVDPEVAVG